MTFGARGVAPLVYTVLAFVLGTTVGTMLRRTLPAKAVTLLVLVAVQLIKPLLVRQHILETVEQSVALADATANREIDSLRSADDDPTSPVEVSGCTARGLESTERSEPAA